jgi:hypothetical protein
MLLLASTLTCWNMSEHGVPGYFAFALNYWHGKAGAVWRERNASQKAQIGPKTER